MCRRGENIYKRKDGRYEGRYVIGKKPDGTTKFGYIFGRHYTDVRARLLQKKAEQISASKTPHLSAPIMVFSAWVDKWMDEEVIGNVKPSTFQTYENIVRKHLLPYLGGNTLDEINARTVLEFIEHLENAGFAESTIRGAFRLLFSAMKAAQEEGLIRKNPCYKIRIQHRESREQEVLTLSQQESIRLEAGEENMPALISLYTGMRLGEICALKWSDIDWEGQTVAVNRTAQRRKQIGGKKTMIMIGAPKTNRSHRIIPIPKFIIDLLLKLRETTGQNPFIFGKQGSAAEPRSIQRHFQKLLQKLGITNAHFHTLRHTFATRLIEMGIDVRTVSDLMGHSSTKTTLDVYMHSFLERRRDAIERMAERK